MAGVSLEYRIDDAELRAAWRQLGILMDDATPVMRVIGTGLVKDTHGHFEGEVGSSRRRGRPKKRTS
ncbi:hypothetical protein SAMN02745172_00532 [Pseudoxanthobacter soli DSM 19599]|uniref:Uncharacterized protein n=1 Tax=Pseudoxanthobacter soli DSM 19599 TaxID=1123029 RepID=A0A1M7Z817_9HYPH|nr:hypothetical protein [Pseudoxanthobacter soli]SHO61057.1 hypothetical protein SAMN02745172_00532 [Pseudoxanthobacter soli DSM 19599]